MSALLRFEFRKLFKNKTFYVCLAISIGLLILNTIISKVSADLMKEFAEEMGESYIYEFSALSLLKTPLVTTMGLSNTVAVQVIALSIIVCEDFVGDIIKNVYSKGYSRTQVYFAKLISSFVAFFLILLGGMIISFVLGIALTGELGSVGKNYVGSLFCILLLAVAFFIVYYSICIIFKKVASSIVLGILGPAGLVIILTLLNLLIKNEDITLNDYWIYGAMNNLAAESVDNKAIIISIVVSIVTIIGFGCLSFFLNNKKDVK